MRADPQSRVISGVRLWISEQFAERKSGNVSPDVQDLEVRDQLRGCVYPEDSEPTELAT